MKASERPKKRKKGVAVVHGKRGSRGEVSSGKNGRRAEEKIKGKTVRMKM